MDTKNLQKLLDFLEDNNMIYQWISLANKIPDKALTDSPQSQNLLKQYGLLSLEAMKCHTNRYFGDDATSDNAQSSDSMNIANITPSTDNDHKKIFFNRVRSNMIEMAIKNNLTSESWHHLMLKREEFTWTKSDGMEVFGGLTLIWVILTMLKPMRNIGLQAKVKAIESTKLLGYGNDPLKMLDTMELKFCQIKDLSGETVFTMKQFTIQVFRTLLSTTNHAFKCYVKSKKYPFDEGNNVNVYSIIKSI
eukprot:15365880-Ditylum_brightwellii.AAC.1